MDGRGAAVAEDARGRAVPGVLGELGELELCWRPSVLGSSSLPPTDNVGLRERRGRESRRGLGGGRAEGRRARGGDCCSRGRAASVWEGCRAVGAVGMAMRGDVEARPAVR